MREKIEFNLENLTNIMRLHCTHEDLASYFNVSVNTIRNRLKDDPEFQQAYEHGLGHGRLSLRRMQFKAAEEGNPSMLIWLGKQMLDQRDKTEVDNYNHNDPVKIEIVNPDV